MHIVKEDLVDHFERLTFLLDLHAAILDTFPLLGDSFNLRSTQFCDDIPPIDQGQDDLDISIPVSSALSFLRSETHIRTRWAQNYVDRVGIQINLYYSLAAQKDNRTNVEIAEFTSRIATETQKDSSSMITYVVFDYLST